MTVTYKAGDRVLIPAVIVDIGDSPLLYVRFGVGERNWMRLDQLTDPPIPDTRRPAWADPGVPGTVAEWGGERWARNGDRWYCLTNSMRFAFLDADVPRDAVLLLAGEKS